MGSNQIDGEECMIIREQRWPGLILVIALLLASPQLRGQESGEVRYGSGPALDQLKLGYTAMETGEFKNARDHYTAAHERADTDELRFQALVGLGSAEAALQSFDEAAAAYDLALKIKPGHPEVLFSLGMVAKDEGRFDDAASFFARAAVRKPGFGAALTQLGVVYSFQERHADAEGACWKAVTAEPDNVEALMCLGIARYHLGFYAEAAPAFEAVLDAEPFNSRARYSLGLCRLFEDDRNGALVEYEALKELDPVLAADLYARIYPELPER